jgi:hypothetical protein
MNKKGLEFSFGWLFAIVVGAAIIFLAVYAAIKFIGSEQTVQETQAAKQLETILTPIETGYEAGKSSPPIVFPGVTRVYNNCSSEGNFGEQSIRVSTLFGNKWQEQGLPIVSYNKYIFSPDLMQSKEMYVLSKQFEMPFKVANILIIWSDKYCFENPTPEIENEITDLNLNNINITDDITKCDKNSKKVCFVSQLDECDVFVNTNANSVTKRGSPPVYYEGSLIYGAIFSEPEVYECQLKRLMKRTSELALLYNDKSGIVAGESGGCSSGLQGDLKTLASESGQLNSSVELRGINILSEELGREQELMTKCKLWES